VAQVVEVAQQLDPDCSLHGLNPSVRIRASKSVRRRRRDPRRPESGRKRARWRLLSRVTPGGSSPERRRCDHLHRTARRGGAGRGRRSNLPRRPESRGGLRASTQVRTQPRGRHRRARTPPRVRHRALAPPHAAPKNRAYRRSSSSSSDCTVALSTRCTREGRPFRRQVVAKNNETEHGDEEAALAVKHLCGGGDQHAGCLHGFRSTSRLGSRHLSKSSRLASSGNEA
jgi:hypothetical protein